MDGWAMRSELALEEGRNKAVVFETALRFVTFLGGSCVSVMQDLTDTQLLHSYLHLGVRAFIFAPRLIEELECLPDYLQTALRVIQAQERSGQRPAAILLDKAIQHGGGPAVQLWLQSSLMTVLSVLLQGLVRPATMLEICNLSKVLYGVLQLESVAAKQGLAHLMNDPGILPTQLTSDIRFAFLSKIDTVSDEVHLNKHCIDLNAACRALGL